MEEKPSQTLIREIHQPEAPIQLSTDMVELLVLVVDDLCVQVGELKEKVVNDKTKK